MAKRSMRLSTGLPQLDRVFRGVMPGDNIVWQIGEIEDYLEFVIPFAEYAKSNRNPLIYFRFADHPPLLDEDSGAVICNLDPKKGFEAFIKKIHQVINEEGRATSFVFDCLSQLTSDWKSDRMLGNFFMLVCPHLYDRAAIAYFAIHRNFHSFHAVQPITNTTQILANVHRHKGELYIHPQKVQYRHSSTMYMLHRRVEDDFVPITQSSIITETFAGIPWSRLDSNSYVLGFWSRTFAEAEAVQAEIDNGVGSKEEEDKYFQKLLRMLISHDEPVLQLARKYLSLKSLLDIRKRMIGTGLIGGKAVGMLLARAILTEESKNWDELLEKHDSFFIGADVFYTYLVQNGSWWMMQNHKLGSYQEDETETARRRILAGDFPQYIITQFSEMLAYFGQSPIIVRSSSLMEDNFGNAFAGKYESVFCANQSDSHKRLEDFLCAVRTVYASTMSEEALEYRAERGLLEQDEQMGLLIQRVSGATYGNIFMPQAAGVAFSFNPYVWNSRIDPNAGLFRIVFGVGTRAVDRADDDYTRVVALNDPSCRPEANFDEVRQYSQRRVDVLDLEANQLISTQFADVVKRAPDVPLDMFTSRDFKLERQIRQTGRIPSDWETRVLTFDKLLNETSFVKDMREMLEILKTAYNYQVDVEWTLNFFEEDQYRINIVQCRPLQILENMDLIDSPPEDLDEENLFLEAEGAVIGTSLESRLDWLIYVVPEEYSQLPDGERYEVARIIGEIAHHRMVCEETVMLIGPGRWGTTTPSLGVPIKFAEITPVDVLCELVMMRDNLIPDVSLGTHFFNEMVENNMLYLALFPQQKDNLLRTDFFHRQENSLAELLPEYEKWAPCLRVIRASDLPEDQEPILHADTMNQRVICYTRKRQQPEYGKKRY